MVRAICVRSFLGLLVSTAAAQSSTSVSFIHVTSPSSTSPSASSITSSPESSTTQNVPLHLWSIATSLLTHYYPSTTITDPADLRSISWPGTIVIGSSTYTIHTSDMSKAVEQSAKTTTTHAPTPTAIGSEAAKEPQHAKGDKRLAIILGVVIGCVALSVMLLVFCCLWRRRRNTGSFFMSRRPPSTISNGSWMPGRGDSQNLGTTTYVSAGAPRHNFDKYPQMSVMPRRKTPPMTMHPALHNQSSRSTSDENPFYTPQERSTTHLNHHEIDGQEIKHSELDHYEPSQRRSSSSIRDARPPTPFSPMMMQQMPAPAARPQLHVNPFSSPEDAEADDVVSPIVPNRNPERRYSPIIHYPSWDEVSEFNFSGDERERNQDGGDGWRPTRDRRERKSGRYELA